MFGAVLALVSIEFLMFVINISDLGISLSLSFNRFIMAMSIAVTSGIVAGIAPALAASRMPPVEAMRMN